MVGCFARMICMMEWRRGVILEVRLFIEQNKKKESLTLYFRFFIFESVGDVFHFYFYPFFLDGVQSL